MGGAFPDVIEVPQPKVIHLLFRDLYGVLYSVPLAVQRPIGLSEMGNGRTLPGALGGNVKSGLFFGLDPQSAR